ncbi:MAG TPA: hypothetical protein VHM31_02020 [Polyangia bacterium]|nr:hypothetical protein [Polyangia bacterium]
MFSAIWLAVLVGLASLVAVAALLLVPAFLLSRFLRGIPATASRPAAVRVASRDTQRGLPAAAHAGAHVILDLNR